MEPQHKRLRAQDDVASPSERVSPVTASDLVLWHLHPALAALPHVTQSINGCYVAHTHKWTLETASVAGYQFLLSVLAVKEWPGVDAAFREARFLYNIRTAARRGLPDVLHWWRTKYLPHGPDVAGDILRLAAYKSHLNVIQWLHEVEKDLRSISLKDKPLVVSLPEIAYWIHEHIDQANMEIHLEKAALKGDHKFINWVKTQAYAHQICERTIAAAAEGGHLEVLQYLIKQSPDEGLTKAYVKAADHGHLHVVQWLLKKYEFPENILQAREIAEMEHYNVIKWFIEEYEWRNIDLKVDWIMNAMAVAAKSSDMEMLQYLYGLKPSNIETDILGFAASSGNLEIVRWLYERGDRGDQNMMVMAVHTEKLDVVKWIHEHCPDHVSTTDAMDFAAQHSLDIVQFLHEHRSEGCTTNAMDCAACCGHLDIIQFLFEHRTERCTNAAMHFAASRGHLSIVRWLSEHNLGAGASRVICAAACNGQLKVVQWLYESGLVDHRDVADAYKAAIEDGCIYVAAYLWLHCEASHAHICAKRAVIDGRFSMLEWLQQHEPNHSAYHLNAELGLQEIFGDLSPLYLNEDSEEY